MKFRGGLLLVEDVERHSGEPAAVDVSSAASVETRNASATSRPSSGRDT
jgi:hypothetical protein